MERINALLREFTSNANLVETSLFGMLASVSSGAVPSKDEIWSLEAEIEGLQKVYNSIQSLAAVALAPSTTTADQNNAIKQSEILRLKVQLLEIESRLQRFISTKALLVPSDNPLPAKHEDASPVARPKAARPFVRDQKLANALNRAFDKLEAYFPEGKVFAFDSIDKTLRERMAELYKQVGYSTVDEMLHAYGFELISGSAVRELRSFVMYTPGNEPDVIKTKVDNMLALMEKYYPDHVVPRSIQNDHKNLSGTISGLYQWLGYESAGDMLRAYGFEYNVTNGGRPATDSKPIIDALLEKYKDAPKPRSMGELLNENPELKGPIKTMQNRAQEEFGMTLTKYFKKIGILREGTAPKHSTTPSGISSFMHDFLKSRYESLDEPIYGTFEEAITHLEGMTLKRNVAGQIYIFRAGPCEGTITVPYGIDFIAAGSFKEQDSLEEVFLSPGITEIHAEAFYNCSKLATVVIPEGVISIEPYAFSKCTALTSIVLPKSLQRLAAKAFSGCSSLEKVEILNPKAIISQDAFDGCKFEYTPAQDFDATEAKYFQYSCDRKGTATITGFTGTLEQVVIPSTLDGHPVSAIGKVAFQGNKHLVDVTMPDFITTMSSEAFRDCISLKRIHLSNSITKIVSNSFNGCARLEEINIPDDVTEIKRSTFKDSPLKILHIGKSLSSLDSKSFHNGIYDPRTGRKKTTRAIKKISVDPDNPYLKATGSAVLSKDGKRLMAYLGNATAFSIPDGVEVINPSAFEDLAFLTDIVLPDSLVEIGKEAFSGTALRSVSFGPNVKTIKESAFSECDKLTAAAFNTGLEEIGDCAFDGCPIVSILLPASLKTLSTSSFSCLKGHIYGAPQQSLKIDSANPYLKADGKALYSITSDGKTLLSLYGSQFKTFYYHSNRKAPEYTVAAGTKHIAPAAFKQCSGLEKLSLPEGLLSIGEYAFEGCNSLQEITLPESLESIGSFAFKETAIKEFSLGTAVREIGGGAFAVDNGWHGSATLRTIKVDKANPTFYADKKALYKRNADGSSSLLVYFGSDDTFALPEEVREICAEAFAQNRVVQEIQIPPSVTTIGERAFVGCRGLVRLRVGFAHTENGANYAVIYIPEISGHHVYDDANIHNQFLDCIRVDGSGSIFDFVKYDSLFETIPATKDKILVATDRLKSAIQLVSVYRDQYLAYLRKHAKKAVEIVVEFDDLNGLNTLAELGVFTGKNIDSVIELANKAKKADVLSYLMNYKNSKIGISEEDYDL